MIQDTFNAATNPIDIHVTSYYLKEQSDPQLKRFVFAYTVKIVNNTPLPVKLVGRHWVITDADGNKQVVQGRGVIGEQPHIEPGDHFEYTSGTVLETPVGTMHGFYHMLTERGQRIDADVAPFRLANPILLH